MQWAIALKLKRWSDRCSLPMRSLTDTSSPQRSGLRILIVEDDPVMRLGLEHLLETHSQLQIVGQVEEKLSELGTRLEAEAPT